MTPPACLFHLDFWLELGYMLLALGFTLRDWSSVLTCLRFSRTVTLLSLVFTFPGRGVGFLGCFQVLVGRCFPLGVFGLRRGAGSDFSFHRARDGLVTTLMTMLRCT